MKISLKVTELEIVQELVENFNQRDITWKLRKEGQLFFCATHRLDVIYILKRFNENITNSYSVMKSTRMLVDRVINRPKDRQHYAKMKILFFFKMCV